MFQKNENPHEQENKWEASAGILTPGEVYQKLIAALECREPSPPADWCASALEEEIRRAGRGFEPDAKLRQTDALQTCLFYLGEFARRMPAWIDMTETNDRVKLSCRELSAEIEKITCNPVEVIKRDGRLKVRLYAILTVQTCLIYREETARNINEQTMAKRAGNFQSAKNDSLPRSPVKEEDWYSATAKNIFETVCGKSLINASDKSPEKAQPSLF